MSKTCPGCGSILAETGAPIHETYCPNKNCTYDRQKFMEGVLAIQKARADELTALRSKLEKAREALEWYEAKAAGCRKVTSEGNEARQALDKDGGKLAASTLKEISDE